MIVRRTLLASGVCACLSVAVLLTGCSAGVEDAKPLTTLSASATPTTEPSQEPKGPDGTAAQPYDFGVLAQAGPESRWDVTISETTIDGTPQVVADNPFNEVQDGWQYVVGRVTSVMNDSLQDSDAGQPTSVSVIMPIFVGNDGKIYDIWNGDNSAVVLNDAWIGQPDIIAQVGIQSSGRFAIQVPSAAIPGGRFAIRNEVSGEIIYFGAVV